MKNQSPDPSPTAESFLRVREHLNEEYAGILTEQALGFVEKLAVRFMPQANELLQNRKRSQHRFDQGSLPDFLPETATVRQGDWKIRNIPSDLQDRRVEITGPVDRKMIINALNADVKVFMADFEDSLAPSWDKVVRGQINLHDAVCRTIEHTDPDTGKRYALNDDPAVLICRVRGLHLPEKNVTLDDEQIVGALLDFGLYFFHNYQRLLDNGSGPYFYIPKLQSHLEARWWSDVFHFTEGLFGLEPGTIKATVLIETLPAVFEMDEILYEMRDHIVGLNCGRWDYIFSYIKTLQNHPDRILPDRDAITMSQPFLNAYSRLLIKTCHRRGALAMGGMAALIPVKDPEANAEVLKKVTADKTLEASNGHDGTWVAHPGLARTSATVFDAHLPAGQPNNIAFSREHDAPISSVELTAPCGGERTETGMRENIRIAVRYIEAWISGNGCVPIYGLMEDAATAEISRTAIWQWIHHDVSLSNGTQVTKAFFRRLLDEEMLVIQEEVGENRWHSGRFSEAKRIMEKITTDDELVEFLTLPCYDYL